VFVHTYLNKKRVQKQSITRADRVCTLMALATQENIILTVAVLRGAGVRSMHSTWLVLTS
jgi:hypothetical protein